MLVPQAFVQSLDRQAASLPEVFGPFDGRVTAVLLPSASEFAVPEPAVYANQKFALWPAFPRLPGFLLLSQRPGFACSQ